LKEAAIQSPSSQSTFTKLLGLIRFSHTIFALPFAALACVWAMAMPWDHSPTWAMRTKELLAVLVCMVSARSAAMAFNRLVDSKFDAANPRTMGRHLPAQLLDRRAVWLFFIVCCAVFLVGCSAFLPNWLPLALAVPVLVWLCTYSYAKRFTALAHLWLGLALALSPICTWIALRGSAVVVTPSELIPSMLLGLAIALWVAGFDIVYACQDTDFDRGAGLHSAPVKLGVAGALRVSAGLHLAMWLTLLVLPLYNCPLELGWIYGGALAVVAVLLIRQHWIVSADNLDRVNEAFFTLNALISFGFTAAAGLDAWI
jgi:4-hydroxybenzoate polyprenyltransferase